MIFTLRGARPGSLRNSFAAVRSLSLMLSLACVTAIAGAQLKVGQPIDFGSTAVGNSISTTVVFSATTATTVTSAAVLTDGATGQDFTPGTDSCTGTIQPNATCSVAISFTPKQVGVRHGVLLLYNGTTLINQVFLHGIGSGGAFAFAPANVTSLNAAPGLTPATFSAGAAVEDGNGNFFFTDVANGRILEQSAAGVISLVAILPLRSSSSIAIGADGTLYVSALSSVFAFLPGSLPVPLVTTGTTLVTPTGLAMDATGDLYIADAATGQLSTYSLSTGLTASVPIVGLSPALSSPQGVGIGPAGDIYVADSGNDRVVEVAAGSGRSTVLTLTGVSLTGPTGLTLDPAGTVYVADTGNSRVVEITVNGVDFALVDPQLNLKTPTGVLMKPNGDLLVSDLTYGLVLVPRSIPSVNFPTPTIVGSLDTTDGAIALALQATGNSVAQLVFPNSGTEPTISTNAFGLTNAGTCPSVNQGNPYTPLQFAIGDICNYTISFTPLVQGLNKASFEVDISLPGGSPVYTTIVPLTGIGLSSVASFSFVASPSSTTVGAPVSLTLTALNGASGTATDYVGTVTFTSTDPTSTFPSGTSFTFTAANKGVLSLPSGITFNHVGVFTVHATDGTFSANSNPVTVLDASTVSSFTSSVNPSLPGQTTTLLATVGSTTPGGPVPTGTVSFYNAGVLIGTATLLNGVAQLNTSFASPGTYPLTAVYSGDLSTAGSTSGILNQIVVYVTTATSFTSSVNPSLVNQSTVLTLTISSAGPAPTGTVKFYDGATLIGTGTVAGGAASVTVSFATAGTHPLTAVYSGDASNATVSATLNQIVDNPVSITLTSSINPSLVNQTTSFSVTVSSANAQPTGTVKIYDGATLLGTITLVNGAGTLPASFTTVGIHTITAVYAGDQHNIGATSGNYAQDVVTPATAVGFTSSVNPSLINQGTVLTLTLASTAGSPAPTGTVKFYSGATFLGTGTVANGVATLTTSFAIAGSYQLTAVYSGDNNNATVTAGPLTQVVVVVGTTITLTSSVNPSLVVQNTVLTATLGNAAATGTVSFYDGATLLGSATVATGSALLTVSFATVGVHTLTAVYSGDLNDTAATSLPYAQDVVTPTTATVFTSSVNPSQIGQNTVLSVTLTGTSGTPTGTVKFYDGTTLIGSGSVVNGVASGVATLTISFATSGIHPLTAVYSGDTNNATVTAGPLNQIVLSAGTIVLTTSVNPSLVNQSVTLTAFLGTTTASGTVKFYDGATLLGTATISAGSASLPATFATIGIHTLTAVYSGDASNAAITSAPYAQDVVNAITTGSATLTSSINPTSVGQSTTFTLTLAATGPRPTGTVKFYSGATLLGTATLTNGVAALPASFAAAGSYPITAVYSGDSNYATFTAGPLSQVVVSANTVVLTSSINPSLVNQNTTLTAFLAQNSATGTVKFYNGATLMGTSTVASGVATINISFPTPGIQTLTAVYSGDTNNAPATSAPYAQDVVTATLVAGFNSSVNPSTLGQSTTLTLALAGNSASPTGTVKFYDGTTLLGIGTVVNGVATLTVSFSTPGIHPLTAIYSGDNNNATVTAGPLNQVVTAIASTITLTATVNPVLLNANTQLIATVSPAAATGTVSFFDGATLLGTGTVSGGVATLTVSFATVGIHSLTAIYNGDTNDTKATSAAYSEDVQNPDSAVLTSSVNPVLTAQQTILTATITSLGQIPTGTVIFYDGATALGTGTVVNGVATLPVSFSTPGLHSLTCKYSGDTNDAPATCAAITQDVQAQPTITLSSGKNPSLVNQSVTFSVTVSSPGPTPTGTVKFFSGATLIGTGTLAGGATSIAYTFTAQGTYPITAVYSGDNNTAAGTSVVLSQLVLNVATITLTSSINPIFIDNPTILTAVATSTGVTPTGLITFYDGAAPVGNATLVNGTAKLSVSFPASGSHTLTAVYYGDPITASATSAPYTQTAADFSVASAAGMPTTASILQGGTATYSLVLTPLITTTLPAGVVFSVTGLPPGATATFTPPSVAAGGATTPFILTINTPAIAAQLHGQPRPTSRHYAPIATALLLLPLAGFLRRKRLGITKLGSLLALLMLAVGTSALTGCVTNASSGYYGVVPHTYNLIVTGTSGQLTRTTGLTLTVQ